MNHTLMHEIVTARQSDLLRDSARRRLAGQAKRASGRTPGWTRTRTRVSLWSR
ncbi:MAG TPA: hypothetical protein VFV89_09430 [Nocardioides sp.]|uniref:hypothetical protein n=1 Tax=Nocardioides sp. TaxID=35761 RepID=UPI002E31F888|nr:hypothetical protein [Nocardioides sp.]HEX5088020.1 hypothetical protein [Nocardioides sp.]